MAREKIVILCGGEGSRLRPLTNQVPKTLVEINGKPILQYLMEHFSKQNYNEFVLCIGFKGQMVRDFIKKKNNKKWVVKFSDSGKNASMMERILDALQFVNERFIVCYGDTITNIDIDRLLKYHSKKRSLATITTYPMQSHFGVIEINKKGRAVSFKEKPFLPYWISIGFMVFEKSVFKRKQNDFVRFLEMLSKEKKLFAFKHKGKHITINTEKDLNEAGKKISEFYTYL